MSLWRDPCVPLEDVAAFAEGRLYDGPRERVVEHLARCADCRAVLAETLGVLGVLGEPGGGTLAALPAAARATAAPAPRRRPSDRTAVALAGLAAALVLFGAVVVHHRAAATPPDRGRWVASLPAARLVPDLWGGVVMRGAEAASALPRQSAEVGALLVDLEVALAAGADERAAELLHGVAAVVEDAGLLDREAVLLRRLSTERGDALAPEVGRVLPAVEARLRVRFLPVHLGLGAFAEQARLAALAGRADLLEAARVRRHARWALGQDEEPLPDDAREALAVLGRSEASVAERQAAADDLLAALTR